RAWFVVVVAAMASLMVAVGPAVRAVRGAPSPFNPSPGADQPAQVDFNGDGFEDLAIGVPNEGGGGQVHAGAGNILYGSADGLTGTNQLLTQASPEDGDQFGAAVA